MKQCPICQSLAFDDAPTCYGCLHDFTGDELESPSIPAQTTAFESVSTEASASDQAAVASGGAPPSFVIKIKPERERSGLTSWTCTVDLVPAQVT